MDEFFELPKVEKVINMEASDVGELMAVNTVKPNPKTKVPLALFFRKTTTGKVLFIGGYMEIYIPKIDFDSRKTAVLNGQEVSTFGIFEIHLWKNPITDRKTPPDYITRYLYPSKIVTIPSGIISGDVTLCNEETVKCMILQYNTNAIFIDNTTVIKSAATASTFISKYVFEAFMPGIVKYPELTDLLIEGATIINGVGLDVNASTLEIMFAALSRYSKDLNIPYRVYYNKAMAAGKLSKDGLKMVKMADLPHFTSTWSSFTFQNMDYAITASAVRHNEGRVEPENDIEKAIKY